VLPLLQRERLFQVRGFFEYLRRQSRVGCLTEKLAQV
jgi:hypothetical protein